MIKKLFIILLVIPFSLFGQKDNRVYTCFQNSNYESAYHYIHKRNNWMLYVDSIDMMKVDTVYYVYHFHHKKIYGNSPIAKEEFLNGGFMDSLFVNYYKDYTTNRFIPVQVFLPSDSLGWIQKERFNKWSKFGVLYNQYLLNLLRNNSMDCIFYSETFYRKDSGFSGIENLYYGLKGNRLFVIYLFHCIPIEEFLEWGYDYMAGNTEEIPEQLVEMYNNALKYYLNSD